MYSIKNGIFTIDGKPDIALGVSYYASFNKLKAPVMPDVDPYPDAKLDIAEMRQAGFNFIRFAARGDFYLNDKNEVAVETPLIDYMTEQAGLNDIAVAVRLQGYSMDLHNRDNIRMLNQNGEEIGPTSSFIVNCCCDEGIIADNIKATIAFAEHFRRFRNVVGYQIYNEPCYQTEYDYHPKTIASFRRKLVADGVMSEAEAANYDPPRDFTKKLEHPEEMMRWKLFLMDVMCNFLASSSEASKAGCPGIPTFTCSINSPMMNEVMKRGINHFESARSMDIVGISLYGNHWGKQYYEMSRNLNGAESAAAVYNKHAWIIEYDVHTNIKPTDWEKETYHALGCGYKGILYYQWRCDANIPGAPEIGGLGLIGFNREHGDKYDTAVAMNRMISGIGGSLATAERIRSGVGILYSINSHAYCFANGTVTQHQWTDAKSVVHTYNSAAVNSILFLTKISKLLLDMDYNCDYVRSEDLAGNILGIQTLFIPTLDGITSDELDDIYWFSKNHPVYIYSPVTDSYINYSDGKSSGIDECILPEVIARVETDEAEIDARVLENEREYIICVNNHSQDSTASAPVLHLRSNIGSRLKLVTYYTPYEEKELEVSGSTIRLPAINTGCIIKGEKLK